MRILSSLKFVLLTFGRAALGAAVLTAAAHAADQGTATEAEAMVKKAVAYAKTNGSDKAYEEISNGKSFKDRDLYLVVFDLTGKNLAHGTNPKLIGKDLLNIKDPDGKPFVRMLVDLAKDKGKGWSENFKFINPATQKIESKAMYIERVGDTLIAAGIYKDKS